MQNSCKIENSNEFTRMTADGVSDVSIYNLKKTHN